MSFKKLLTIILIIAASVLSFADCPLDHLSIGRNPDGIIGSGNDNQLFVDRTQKYRRNPDSNDWQYWYYKMYWNPRWDRYSLGQPGFEMIGENDPNRALPGTPNIDYSLIVECVSISENLSVHFSGLSIEQPGDSFNYTQISDTHLHFDFYVQVPQQNENTHWVTFIVYDDLDNYEPSEPFTIVFLNEPLKGDLVVDGLVDEFDLAEMGYYWLKQDAGRINDWHERADINRDGKVDMKDFALFAANWREFQY